MSSKPSKSPKARSVPKSRARAKPAARSAKKAAAPAVVTLVKAGKAPAPAPTAVPAAKPAPPFGRYYKAPREPEVTSLGRARYLAIEGHGAPRSAAWNAAVHALYTAAFGVKSVAKAKGFEVPPSPLEAQCWSPGKRDVALAPPAKWHWQLLLRVPDYVPSEWLDAARDAAAERGKEAPGLERVRVADIDEGTVVQALHVGTHSKPTIARMQQALEERNLKPTGVRHEVYLSGTSKTARTILRQPVTS